jgi:hypothetical protein
MRMSESLTHYRCNCPQCKKVIRVRTEWAGKKGVCPHCRHPFEFPAPPPQAAGGSGTTQQLQKLVTPDDEVTFEDAQSDRMAMLLSQGTCRDYELAIGLLAGRPLSPRQWRRTLNAADLRESMRLRFSRRLDENPNPEVDASEPAALALASDDSAAAPNAWKILARFLYFQRHGLCEQCQSNLTGMSCIYLDFGAFLAARNIGEPRAEHWQKLMRQQLGL